jgi:hypothetical protein
MQAIIALAGVAASMAITAFFVHTSPVVASGSNENTMKEPLSFERMNQDLLYGEPVTTNPDSLDDFHDIIRREVESKVRDQFKDAIISAEPLFVVTDLDAHRSDSPFHNKPFEPFVKHFAGDDSCVIDIDNGETNVYLIPKAILVGSSTVVRISSVEEEELIRCALTLQEQQMRISPYGNTTDRKRRLIRREEIVRTKAFSEQPSLDNI